MKKKIFSINIIVLLLVLIITSKVYATNITQNPKNKIRWATTAVYEPKAGIKAKKCQLKDIGTGNIPGYDQRGYFEFLEESYWIDISDENNKKILSENDIFEAGKKYIYRNTLKAESENEFADNVEIHLNNELVNNYEISLTKDRCVIYSKVYNMEEKPKYKINTSSSVALNNKNEEIFEAQEGDKIYIKANPDRPTKIFYWWNFNSFLSVKADDAYNPNTSFIMPACDVNVMACYGDAKFVTFDINGAKGENIEVKVNSKNKIDKIPTINRDGYEFLGWYTWYNGGKKIDENTLFESNTVVYARWKYIGEFNIVLDPNGGKCDLETIKTDINGKISEIPTPSRVGYEFLGWFTEKENGEKVESGKEFKDSINLYAHWKKIDGKEINYEILEGKQSIWNSKQDFLSFRVDADISKFVEVQVDDNIINRKYYDLLSGSTIVKFKKEFLDTLSNGNHRICMMFIDGECTTTFVVNKDNLINHETNNSSNNQNNNANLTQGDLNKFVTQDVKINQNKDVKNPQTSDNIYIYVSLGVISFAGIIIGCIYLLKNKNKNK